jgi:hypothetical protein
MDARGLSQREKAAALGVSHRTIQRDTGGTNVPENDRALEENDDEIGTNVPEPSESESKAHVAPLEWDPLTVNRAKRCALGFNSLVKTNRIIERGCVSPDHWASEVFRVLFTR